MTNILNNIGNLFNFSDRRQSQYHQPANSIRNNRVYNEIMMVAPMFNNDGGIRYDQTNYDWIIIPQYPLPAKWTDAYCQLLILFPNTYPYTPPIGFYLSKELQLYTGGSDPHLLQGVAHDAPEVPGWYWYCVTIQNEQGGWRASANYQQPDNLMTYLEMVRESLTNDF